MVKYASGALEMSNMFPVRHCCLCLHKISLSIKSPISYRVNNKLRQFSTCSRLKQAAEFYDVVISGGGMVGAAMAAALGDCKIKFLICKITTDSD